ncbi:TRAF3-interacting JNK-activating modulator isoform X2 [Dasypus novemcinctus]|uniref:TRAF3-interacting JNK-activating modulator isoform X2 n=1 Tax=Dasypus novemcinctus TaxID=9361 RepID=UPI00062A76FC|nr:TRAF3-interacting JNK-activating modulator isoform X2 [Dasypus novemcinctus]
MIHPDPRPYPGWARRAESYEAKCERRQETRESRRCRPNVTTCRQVGKALRSQQREQLRRARQQQFFKRRNLEVEEKGKTQSSQAREQGHASRTGQARDLKEPLSQANRSSAPRQQVAGTCTKFSPTQQHPPSGVWRDLAEQRASQPGSLPPQASPIERPPKHHRGTQTKAEGAQSTIKNDASQQTNCGVAVLDKEIIQLSEYLKEALQRELVLKQKMVILQDLLSTLIQASDNSWKGQLNEDKLKGKLRSLENQLYTCTQKYSPWGVKKVLLEMEDQKNSYEQRAKESLQKVLEEKMSAERQLQSTQVREFCLILGARDPEAPLRKQGRQLHNHLKPLRHHPLLSGHPQRSLAVAEQKCEEWRTQYEALKEDWSTLGTQHRELESQLHVLQSKLQGADSRDLQMNQALRLLENEHQELQAKIKCLQGDRDLDSSDTQDLQDQLTRSEEEKLALVAKVQHLQNRVFSVWSPKPSHKEVEPEGTGEEKDWDLRDQLQKKTLQLQAKEKECKELHSELDNLSDEYLSCLRKLQHCREELNRSQQTPPRRQCGRWLPILIVVIATALAAFLASKDSLMM